ncbi:MAG: peptidase T [Bacteroidota bacterium]|nr:peptidase T [Bacteroidota bacterium]
MITGYSHSMVDRFFRYVQIDTQSNPDSTAQPSSAKQLDLSRLLLEELKALGLTEAELDEYGYVFASIPSNSEKSVPVICYCAHVDTSPDCKANEVKPLLHKNYSGGDIVLPDDPEQIIRTTDHPYLLEKIGKDIITASGKTLLGADDKAGITVIMELAAWFMQHPEIKHGKIRILFTPDEEIGRGVNKLDMKKLGADFGYTLDGPELGSFEEETFSADSMTFIFYGVSAHPGHAKDKLVNAIKIASEFIRELPSDEFSPETTEGRYGFVHPVRMEGNPEKMRVDFIVRDFNTPRLHAYEDYLKDKAEQAILLFPSGKFEYEVTQQYRNMKEVLVTHPEVSENARQAMRRAGIEIKESAARGGTDGSRLSFMGLPCPNIFTGEMAFHGKHEYVCVQDMEKSLETLIHLAMIWEENTKPFVLAQE